MIKKYKLKNPQDNLIEAILVDLKNGRDELRDFLGSTKHFLNDSKSVVIHAPNFIGELEIPNGNYLIRLQLGGYESMTKEMFEMFYEEDTEN